MPERSRPFSILRDGRLNIQELTDSNWHQPPRYGAEAGGTRSDSNTQMRNAVHALRASAQQIDEVQR